MRFVMHRVLVGIFVVAVLSIGTLLWAATPAEAFIKTFGGATGFSASVDVSLSGGNLVLLITNTTTAGASDASAGTSVCPSLVTSGIDSACRLLSSIGWSPGALGSNQITGGSAFVPIGETYFGDIAGGPTTVAGSDFDWSAEWGYANDDPPDNIDQFPTDGTADTFDFASTNAAQATGFGGTNRDGPAGLDGPQGGILSSFFTGAGGLGYVQDRLRVTLTFGTVLGASDLTALQNADWFVEYGSSGYFLTSDGNGTTEEVPEAAAILLGAIGLVGVMVTRRRQVLAAVL